MSYFLWYLNISNVCWYSVWPSSQSTLRVSEWILTRWIISSQIIWCFLNKSKSRLWHLNSETTLVKYRNFFFFRNNERRLRISLGSERNQETLVFQNSVFSDLYFRFSLDVNFGVFVKYSSYNVFRFLYLKIHVGGD